MTKPKTPEVFINSSCKGLSSFYPDATLKIAPSGTVLGHVQPHGSNSAEDTVENGAINETIPKLFSPLKVRGLTIPNRIGVSPMCTYSSNLNGCPGDFHLGHYSAFFFRGPGITFVEATSVTPEGRISPEDLGLWNEIQASSHRRIVDLAHSQGAKIGVQLAHAGRKASTAAPWLRQGLPTLESTAGFPYFPNDVVAPSALSFKEGNFVKPRELTEEEIKGIVASFAESARLAVNVAGYDVVMIHGAHGYLINEFLSPFSNRRTDKYGGSFENRTRLLEEVIIAVREVIGPDRPLFLRVSAVENVDNEPLSWTLDDTVKLSERAYKLGVDVVDVSSGGNNPNQHFRGTGEGQHVPYARAIKDRVGDKGLVSVVGGFRNGEYAQKVVDDGSADLILVGRAFLRNPGLVWTWADQAKVNVHGYVPYSFFMNRKPPVLSKDTKLTTPS